MTQHRHFGSVLIKVFALFLLVASVLFVRWYVQTHRPPGAMTVIEAQAMDMSAMKPPIGAHPVAVEPAEPRFLVPSEEFPGTVFAYSDEEVVARVMGRVVKTFVYPGDRVRAGQLLARLEASEYAFESSEAGAEARAGSEMVRAAEIQVARLRESRDRARAEARAMKSAVDRAQADAEMAEAEWEMVQSEYQAKQFALSEREAELRYAQQEWERAQRLYRAGAISLDEYQQAQTQKDTAQARVSMARAEVSAFEKKLFSAERRLSAMRSGVAEARARWESAEKAVKELEREVEMALAELSARRAEAEALRHKQRARGALSGYTELRALHDSVVAERVASPGAVVMPGDVVFRLKDIHQVRVQAELPERLQSRVRLGTPVTLQGLHHSQQWNRPAKITSVFPIVQAETRTFRVEALVNNSQGDLLPGMFVRVRVQTAEPRKVLTIRREAVRRTVDQKPYVWVLSETKEEKASDWTCTMHPEISQPGPGVCPICKMDLVPRERKGRFVATRREVRVGETDGQYVEITQGLHAGERVIWAGFENLTEGAPVQPVPWAGEGPGEVPPPETPSAPSTSPHSKEHSQKRREGPMLSLGAGERGLSSLGPKMRRESPFSFIKGVGKPLVSFFANPLLARERETLVTFSPSPRSAKVSLGDKSEGSP
jgi:multidrug efflux pump subunit AcrA (membrane-fusion protein)